jgi:putative glutamine amidotransferase
MTQDTNKIVTSKDKPVIGVTPKVSWAQSRQMHEYTPGYQYVNAVTAAGAVPFVLPPLVEQVVDQVKHLDAIVFTGGGDIDPYLYGEDDEHKSVYGINELRDHYEFALLNEAVRQNIPILGICRGLQLINVGFGGTLYQDIVSLRPNSDKIGHNGGGNLVKGNYASNPYHHVRVKTDSLIADVYQMLTFRANSYHHQAVRNLGEGLVVGARAGDGVVEALYHKDRPILATQFHPEMMYNLNQLHYHSAPFDWLVTQALSRAKANGRIKATKQKKATKAVVQQITATATPPSVPVNTAPTPVTAPAAPQAPEAPTTVETVTTA